MIATDTHIKTLIVGVYAPHNRAHQESYFEEFLNLVRTDQIEYEEAVFMKLRSIDSSYYFTAGKLQDLVELCGKHQFERIVISEPLSVQQHRNLEDTLNADVVDRTLLILEIFEKGAHSAEGKLQVELALFEYQKTRLAGKGILLSQQGGRRGNKGPGETLKERETRHIEHLMQRIRKDLDHLARVRDTQRKQRLKRKEPLLCLIGYTNAGKSTLLNLLTKSSVLAEDKLFATLDTTTRELVLDGKKVGLLSDTVGFIQQLPHHLIEAFKSTLQELHYANLLLHVIDASDPNFQTHIQVVHEVLKELEVDKPMLYIFNKADKVTDVAALQQQISQYTPHVVVSAAQKESVAGLVEFLRNWFATQSDVQHDL